MEVKLHLKVNQIHNKFLKWVPFKSLSQLKMKEVIKNYKLNKIYPM
jgi:hypothetical protein